MDASEALGLSPGLLVNAASYVNHDGSVESENYVPGCAGWRIGPDGQVEANTCADTTPPPAQKSDQPGIDRAAAAPKSAPPPPPPPPPPKQNGGITTMAPMKGRLGGYGRLS